MPCNPEKPNGPTCWTDEGPDKGPFPPGECATAECATNPPPSTNCSYVIDCYNKIVRGGTAGGLILGGICGKIIGIPGTGSACSAAIWAACGTAYEKQCSGGFSSGPKKTESCSK